MFENFEQPANDPREEHLCPDCGRWSPHARTCPMCRADHRAELNDRLDDD